MRFRPVPLLFAPYRPRAPACVARWLGVMLLVLAGAFLRAQERRGAARKFDLPADVAEISLQRFNDQYGPGVIWAAEHVKGVKTNAVHGEWTPAEALEQMLAGTRLVVTRNAKSGAFAVGPEPADPPALPRHNSRPPPAAAATAVAVVASDNNILTLSPFTVSTDKDAGYYAGNSLAGTRLNEPLRDTASSVSVFTRQFLEDAAITDLPELVRYSVNSELHTNYTGDTVAQAQNGSRIVPQVHTRGQAISQGLDFFVSIIPADPYRVSRYEDSRGPNSILFGVGRPGGLFNQTSKIANLTRNSGAIRYGLGSGDRHRLELEANQVLRQDTLAVTLAAVQQENGGWRAFDFQDKKRIYGAVTFRPHPTLRFTAMGETGRDVAALTPITVEYDAALAWYDNRQAFGAGAVTFASNNTQPTAAQTALGVTGQNGSRDANNHRVTFIENSGTIFDAIGTLLTGSYNNAGVRAPDGSRGTAVAKLRLNDPAIYPRTLNAAGPGAFRAQRLKNYTITADWEPNRNLAFNLAHNYQDSTAAVYFLDADNPTLRGEANRTLGVDGPLNPWAGRLYFDGNWKRQVHRTDIRETRLSASYSLDPKSKWLGQHRLATLLSQSTQLDTLAASWLVLAGHPFEPLPSGANNRITVRNYLTEGDYSTYRVGDWRSLPSAVTFEGKSYPLVFANSPGPGNALNGGGYQDLRSALAGIHSRFAGGKLVTTFGYRRDQIDAVFLGYDADPILGDVVNRNRDQGTSANSTARTGTAGVVYHVSDWLSLLANRSSNQGAREILTVKTFPYGTPARGRGEDYGFGFNLPGGRLNARVVRFTLMGDAGNPGSLSVSPIALNTRVMDAFSGVLVGSNRPYSAAQWDSIYRTYTPTGAATAEYHSAGYEAQVTANLTPQWRLMANYSYTDLVRKNYGSQIIAWYGLKTDTSGRLLRGVTQDASGRFVLDPGSFQSGGTVARWIALGAQTPAADPSVLLTAGGQTVAEEILSLVKSLNDMRGATEGTRPLDAALRPHKLSVFTAYDFKEGWLRGFTLGGGWLWRSPDIIRTDSDGNKVTGRALTSTDLMLAYQWKLHRPPGRVRFQINVSNLFNRTPLLPVSYSTSASAPDGFMVPGGRGAGYSRYDLTPPREIRCTTTYSF